MSEIFTKNITNSPTPYESTNLFLKCFIFGLLGLVLGLSVNTAATVILKMFKLSRVVKALLQILFCSAILGLIFANYSKDFVYTWQNEIPGLFFISVFFGVQYTMYTDLQNYVNSKLIKTYFSKL